MGNVLATVTDARKGVDSDSDGDADYYHADIASAADYYPFGFGMPERSYSSGGDYRFGFQGQEVDPNIMDGCISFKYRIEDSRIGKFLSIDPLAQEFPWNSPYAFSENDVIRAIELEALEKYIITFRSFIPDAKLRNPQALISDHK